MKKKPFITVGFRVDQDQYRKARKQYNVPEYIRWLIKSLADKTIEFEAPKMVIKRDEGDGT